MDDERCLNCAIPWQCCRDCCECPMHCRCQAGPACEVETDAELELLGLILQPPSIVM